MRMVRMLVALVATMVATAGQVQAGLVNGGFETGDLSGWSTAGEDFAIVTPGEPHSGTYNFIGYDNTDSAFLSQSFATTAGTTYDLSFWSQADFNFPGNILRYQVDGGPIITVALTLDYAITTDSFTASGPNATLTFYFETDPGTGAWQIDDVSVTGDAAVPEPASIVMLGLGGIGMGLAAWRRKRLAVA